MKAQNFTIIAVLSLLLAGFLNSMGCNTVKGIGTDIQHASEATSRAIDSAAK